MNKIDKTRIVRHAKQMIYMRQKLVDENPSDCWHKVGEKQAYYDALTSLKVWGLIEDFNLITGEIKIS